MCGLDSDTEDAFESDLHPKYQHVTDSRFKSTADLRNFVSEVVTGAEAQQMLHDLFNPDQPVYLDKDGKLYVTLGGGGVDCDFDKKSIKLADITEEGFSATVSYPEPGNESLKHL